MTPSEFMNYAGPFIMLAGQVWHYYRVKERLESQTADLKQTNVAVTNEQTEKMRETSVEITERQTEELRDSSERKLEKLEELGTVATASAKVAADSAQVVDSIKVLVNGSTEILKTENAAMKAENEVLRRQLRAALGPHKPKKRA